MRIILAILILVASGEAQLISVAVRPQTVAAAPAFVQVNADNTCSSGSTPFTCTLPAAPTAGNAIIVFASANAAPCTAVTTAGDSFQLWGTGVYSSNTYSSVFVATNVGTTNSFQIACPGASSLMGGAVVEVANATTADIVGVGTSTGTAVSISTQGSGATNGVGSSTEYVACEAWETNNYYTWVGGSGYTVRRKISKSTNYLGAMADKDTKTGLSGQQTCLMTIGTSGNWAGSIITLANSPAQGQANVFVDFEGLSNTVTPTATTLQNSTHGPMGDWTVSDVAGATGATAGQSGNLLTAQQLGATSWTGAGSLGFRTPTGTNRGNVVYNFPVAVSTASYGMWVKWDIPQNDTAGRAYSINAIQTDGASANYAGPQIQAIGGTKLQAQLECAGGASAGSVDVATNTWYWMTEKIVTGGGNNSLAIYNTSGSQVGSTLTCASGTGNANSLKLGITGAESESNSNFIWVDNVQINFAGTFPLLP